MSAAAPRTARRSRAVHIATAVTLAGGTLMVSLWAFDLLTLGVPGPGVAMMLVATMSVLSAVIWLNARSVSEIETQRLQAVNDLQQLATSLERRVAEQTAELTRSEAQLRLVVQKAHDAFVAIDFEGRIVEWNPSAEAMFGWQRSEVLGRPLVETLFPERERAERHEGLRVLLSTGESPVLHARVERTAINRNGAEFPIELAIMPLESAHTWHFAAFIRDKTFGKRSEEKFRGLLESAPDAMVIVGIHGLIKLINTRAEQLFGYSRSELIDRPIDVLIPPRFRPAHAANIVSFFAEPTTRPMGAGRELFALRRDGTEFPAEISLSPMMSDEGFLITAAIRDISERKAVERRISESLKEKEALLGEVHHRVKNNMQIISSLLRLQARKLQDPAARVALQESEERILSMAWLHENLYQTGDFGRVDLAPYLRTLASELQRNYGEARGISIRTATDVRELEIEKAVPLGLLVNELITNALKHAFPDRGCGAVDVKLSAANGLCTLTVADDGVGFLDGVDRRREDRSLGLQIIRTLSTQLKGHYAWRRNNGTEFQLNFRL